MMGFLCQRKIKFSCLLSVFCSLFGVLFVGSRVSAVDLNMADYNVIYETAQAPSCAWKVHKKNGSIDWTGFSLDSVTLYNHMADSGTAPDGIHEFICKHSNGNEMTMLPGDFVIIDLRMTSTKNDNNSVLQYNNGFLEGFSYLGREGIDVIDYDIIGELDNYGRRFVYLRLYGRMSSDYGSTPYWGVKISQRASSSDQELQHIFVQAMTMIHLRPKQDNTKDYTSQLNDIKSAVQNIKNNMTSNVADALEEEREAQEEEMTNAQDEAEDSANEQGQAAQSRGTTLLQAFTSFVTALRNASPSNCNIDMDLGNLDLGVVNLCSLSPPTEFQTIASILLIGFCVPLSIATARKVINLFRSFQT